MDAKIRDALRYLKTLPVEDRLIAVLDLSNHEEVMQASLILSDASMIAIMPRSQRALLEKLRQPQLESGPGGLTYVEAS